MRRRERSKHELRCFCRTEPLLATYGVDEGGELYVHLKVYKQQRIYGEVVVTHGVVKLRCRECLRWHRVVIRDSDTAALEETPEPVGVNTLV